MQIRFELGSNGLLGARQARPTLVRGKRLSRMFPRELDCLVQRTLRQQIHVPMFVRHTILRLHKRAWATRPPRFEIERVGLRVLVTLRGVYPALGSKDWRKGVWCRQVPAVVPRAR